MRSTLTLAKLAKERATCAVDLREEWKCTVYSTTGTTWSGSPLWKEATATMTALVYSILHTRIYRGYVHVYWPRVRKYTRKLTKTVLHNIYIYVWVRCDVCSYVYPCVSNNRYTGTIVYSLTRRDKWLTSGNFEKITFKSTNFSTEIFSHYSFSFKKGPLGQSSRWASTKLGMPWGASATLRWAS